MKIETNTETEDESQVSRRRVYELPTELVERILTYQKEKNLPSEVEAARKLLDLALKENENLLDLINQVVIKLEAGDDPVSISTRVLAGHPKVASIDFKDDCVKFTFADKHSTQYVNVYSRQRINFDNDGTTYELKGKYGEQPTLHDTDEIPF